MRLGIRWRVRTLMVVVAVAAVILAAFSAWRSTVVFTTTVRNGQTGEVFRITKEYADGRVEQWDRSTSKVTTKSR